MQYVDRSHVLPPSSLISGSTVKRDLLAVEAFLALEPEQRAQTRPPHLASPSNIRGLKEALYLLFKGRCAFCEQETHSLDIHRFRPVSNAMPMRKDVNAPLYYLWFAWAWQNFYLVCTECNASMSRKFVVGGNRMPVPSLEEYQNYLRADTGFWPQWPPREKSILLDPCQTKSFAAHFEVNPQGDFRHKSAKAEATIAILNLNSPRLKLCRANRYQQYMRQLVDAIRFRSKNDLSEILSFKDLEFGGSWYLLLRRLASLIDGAKGSALSIGKMKPFFLSLFQEPAAAEEKLYQAFSRIYEESEQVSEQEPFSQTVGSLREIQFQNFKSLEKVELSLPSAPQLEGQKPEAQALLILGENAAGKSTILEGIALALITPEGRGKLGLHLDDFILLPKLLAGDPRNEPETSSITLIQDNAESLTLTLRKNKRNRTTKKGAFNVGPVFAYGAFRQYRQGRRLYAADKTVRNLFDGSLLGNPQNWLLSLDSTDFSLVVAALREVLSIEGEFDVIQCARETKECFIITDVKGIKTHTPLNVASSGFRTVLAMVCDIMQGLMDKRINPEFESFENARGVVLIDEVEAHLHPRWKMQIIGGLRRALPSMTFIFTTHDPLCLRGMYNGEVRVMQRTLQNDQSAQTRLPQRVETLKTLPDITKLRVDQLLTSDFFQLDSTDEPDLDRLIAQVADFLAKRERGERLTEEESRVISVFEHDIASAMPVGTYEAHRLVQEAVAQYLQERRLVAVNKMQALRDNTRSRILNILREVIQ